MELNLHSFSGSPPPMRGKVLDRQIFPIIRRITPAYAGKSFENFIDQLKYGDHPRLCGEKLPMPKPAKSSPGSPPPMRGKVWGIQSTTTHSRITPAYAGKSCTLYVFFANSWDHPRLCGEKRVRSVHTFTALGSPPPMRGKVTGKEV